MSQGWLELVEASAAVVEEKSALVEGVEVVVVIEEWVEGMPAIEVQIGMAAQLTNLCVRPLGHRGN